MKAGARAIGIAESYRGSGNDQKRDRGEHRSTLAGVVVRADRAVDGFAFARCTIGGTDATPAAIDLLSALDREDARYVLIAGIAPAWYNLLDLPAIHEAVERPVVSVTFEASDGLEGPLRREFSGEALGERLSVYRRQPPRERLVVNDETRFVRAVGVDADEARDVVRAFTPEGGRPEPLRVARLAARAADRWRADS